MTGKKSEYIRNWLFRADEDFAVMQNLAGSDPESFTSTICFHAHQAVEKYLKTFLIYHNVDFPKTHDLDFLLLECQKIDQNAFDIELKSLTDFIVSIRYLDDFYVPGLNETREYIEIAGRIKDLIKRIIKL